MGTSNPEGGTVATELESTADAPTGDGDAPSTLAPVPPGHYTCGAELARGGMGRILAAHDTRLDRPVAIKELLDRSGPFRLRFEREARITARLQHPAIVPIYEAGTWPSGDPFFAMKLVAGRPLHEVIAATPALDDRIALLPRLIAATEALAYAHSKHIIHRDLKPSNVLLGDYGETVVIDWGIAKDLDGATDEGAGDGAPGRSGTTGDSAQTVDGAVIGTPTYMPPEQARGEPVDPRADVYSLGAMLYELLSGRMPYADRGRAELLAAVADGVPPTALRELVPGVPPELVAIVDKAMAHDRARRYADANELAKDLVRFQSGQLVAVHTYTFGQLVRRWMRRHRGALAVAAVALVVGLAGAVFAVRKVLEERDVANDARGLAEKQSQLAESKKADLEVEAGRQALLRGHYASAVRYLAPAYRYRHGRDVQLMLGLARRGVVDADARIAIEGVTHASIFTDKRGRTRVVVAASGKLRAFDAATGAAVDAPQGDWLAASANHRHVLFDAGGNLMLWDLDTDMQLRVPIARPRDPAKILVADSGTRIVIAEDDDVRVWTHGPGERSLRSQSRIVNLACDADCSLIGIAGVTSIVFVTAEGRETSVVELQHAELAIDAEGKRFYAYSPGPRGSVVSGNPRVSNEQTTMPSHGVWPEKSSLAPEAYAALYVTMTGTANHTSERGLFVEPTEVIGIKLGAHRVFATAHTDRFVRVWRGETEIAALDAAMFAEGLALEDSAGAPRTSRVVAFGPEGVAVWRTAAWPPLVPAKRAGARKVANNGDWLATHEIDEVRLHLASIGGELTSQVRDLSADGSFQLVCGDEACTRVVARRGLRGAALADVATGGGAWLTQGDRWVASLGEAGVELHAIDTPRAPVARFSGCTAKGRKQLWVSADGQRAICADAGGVAAWTGGTRRRLGACPAARIMSSTVREVAIQCDDHPRYLVDGIAGTLTELPRHLQKAHWIELSEDGTRLIVTESHGGVVLDREGRSVAFLDHADGLVERGGLIYAQHHHSLRVWDRERGTILLERSVGMGAGGYDVSPDGRTVLIANYDGIEVHSLPFEPAPER